MMLSSLSEALSIQGHGCNLSEDDRRSIPVIAMAMEGDKTALDVLGIYSPNEPLNDPGDYTKDLTLALRRYIDQYGEDP